MQHTIEIEAGIVFRLGAGRVLCYIEIEVEIKKKI